MTDPVVLFEHTIRDTISTRSWRVTVTREGEVRVEPGTFPPRVLDAIVKSLRRAHGHVKASEAAARRRSV